MKRILGWHHIVDRLLHIAIVAGSLVIAFLLRFDFSLSRSDVHGLTAGLLIAIVVKPVVFQFFGFHKGWRKYFETGDLLRIAAGNAAASIVVAAAVYVIVGRAFPRSVLLIDFGLALLLTGAIRFAVVFSQEIERGHGTHPHSKRILIHGLGEGAISLLREIQSNPVSEFEVAGFLDDDPRNSREHIMGAPVLGSSCDAARIATRMRNAGTPIDEIVITRNGGNGRGIAEVLANCRASGVTCKALPPLTEVLNGQSVKSQIRNVSLTDLLGREPVQLEKDRIHASIAGRSILVTGAAGSIGSEICRQIIKYGPSRLIAFDQAESDLYRLECELSGQGNGTAWVTVLGDIRNFGLLNQVMHEYAVDSIFHAAAYKHVPMLETNVAVGVHNNVMGAWNLARAAAQNGVANLLLISSDKAVNPSSVMGATKRVCELLVSSLSTSPFANVPKCVAVRFGNVLGSNGSVVPLFQAQIEAGGPVTVTHPDMRRYFMTIPEAVMLVLQASTMGTGSDVFVLDMGSQMRIVDLAENMISAAGLVPGKDIEIRYTGVRPGEKLYEELGIGSERTLPTSHDRIKIFRDPSCEWSRISRWITVLDRILERRDADHVVEHLCELVPEFHPDARSHAAVAAQAG